MAWGSRGALTHLLRRVAPAFSGSPARTLFSLLASSFTHSTSLPFQILSVSTQLLGSLIRAKTPVSTSSGVFLDFVCPFSKRSPFASTRAHQLRPTATAIAETRLRTAAPPPSCCAKTGRRLIRFPTSLRVLLPTTWWLYSYLYPPLLFTCAPGTKRLARRYTKERRRKESIFLNSII